MTLPSNSSMDHHPNNTAAKYTTTLSQQVELNGDWEVALAEICVPATWFNVTSDDYEFAVNDRIFSIPDNFYPSIKSVLEKMIELINQVDHLSGASLEIVRRITDESVLDLFQENKIGIVYDQRKDKVGIAIPRRTVFRMTKMLATILGFNQQMLSNVDNRPSFVFERAQREAALVHNLLLAYVYCDLVEPTIVGDTKVQLLRTVNVDTVNRNIVNHIYTAPIYVPLQKKQFGSVEINIMSSSGLPVPFASGKSVVVLHFRRTSNPYFLSR